MAEPRRFLCSHCGREIVTWSDGNPYYRDESGRKHHAYHPSPDRDRCTGNDVPHLCLACGRETTVDSERPRTTCRRCKGGPLVETWELDGRRCPSCDKGEFRIDPEFDAIS